MKGERGSWNRAPIWGAAFVVYVRSRQSEAEADEKEKGVKSPFDHMLELFVYEKGERVVKGGQVSV